MIFKLIIKEYICCIGIFIGGVVILLVKMVGQIGKVVQNFGVMFGGYGKKVIIGYKGYGLDGKLFDIYKLGILNKSMMVFFIVMDGVEQVGCYLFVLMLDVVIIVVQYKWGFEVGEVSRLIGGGVKNVGLVYIDVMGVLCRVLIKSVVKGMVVGKILKGEFIVVGGGDGGVVVIDNDGGKLLVDIQLLSGMIVVEGK